MRNLIKLINDIKLYKLEINKIEFSGYWLNIYLRYNRSKGEIINKLCFRDKYNSEVFLDWYRIGQQHTKEAYLFNDNRDLTEIFKLFLNIRKRLKKEKVVTDQELIDRIQLIYLTAYRFEIQPLPDQEKTKPFTFYLIDEPYQANKQHWEAVNEKAYRRLINYLKGDFNE